MSGLHPLRTAFWNYDRTAPLCDGRVDLGDLALRFEILRPEQTFARMYKDEGFDVCEASFSNTMTMVSSGACPYVLVPAFLSRAFRHGAIFVRTDRGIDTAADLAGKTIGLQEYDMTAAVVVRGLLRDEYSIGAEKIDWRVGDVERLKPIEFPLDRPPVGVSITLRPPGSSLEQGLLSGELDAIVSLRTPQAVLDGDPRVRRLFDDQAERDWFTRRRVFPIMHGVAVRRSLAEAHPGLTRRIYDLFKVAKDIAVAELDIIQVPKITLPWPQAIVAEVRRQMGQDFWPYGIAANRIALETQLRWSREDNLQARPIRLEDIFAADCLDT
jgi:4,5-dihydroxyphthalate decarboxylase